MRNTTPYTMTMKIHVTGAKGFLARWIVPLLRQSHEVCASDRDSLDVTDARAVRDRFADEQPDVVIHLAALCGAQPSRDNPPADVSPETPALMTSYWNPRLSIRC